MTWINSNQADWLFDVNVTVSGTAALLLVNGITPGGTTQQAANKIRASYGSTITVGNAWGIASAETHLTPQPNVPVSGTLV